jgi:magnesium transporter
MITIFVNRDGHTAQVDRVDPAWLQPASGVVLWVDIAAPTEGEAPLLRDVFHFHDLAVEDAINELHYPKLETYDGYLYVILHGIDFRASEHRFQTHDTDFFLGARYLVTVHDGSTRTIPEVIELCRRNDWLLAQGAPALLHRIVDAMVDHYQPEVEKLEDRLEELDQQVFETPDSSVVRRILALKADVTSLRRVTLPQRDVIGRLARREFALIDTEVAYRFRDVYDHLVRLSDEALIFQDRVTGLLEAHVSNVSNRLNEVMKVLTLIATIFMPLTVLTGMWGMNVDLPHLPGGAGAQFWWVVGIMVSLSGVMLMWFRRRNWF